jgi:voltage-gated potassium channel
MKEEMESVKQRLAPLVKTDDLVLLSVTLLAIGIVVYDVLNDLRNTAHLRWQLLVVLDFALLLYFVKVLADKHSETQDRVDWWRRNFWQVLALFPLLGTAIPGLGWVGILRFLLLIPAFTAIIRLLNVTSSESVSIQQRIMHLFIIVFMLSAAGGVLALLFETQYEPTCIADPDCSESGMLHTIGDSMWWAIETVTTVGYGDFYPHSTGARVIATMLMFVGIGLVGTLAATLSQLFYSASHERDLETDRLLVRLELLTELHDRGELTDFEFEKAKHRLSEESDGAARKARASKQPRIAASDQKSAAIKTREERKAEARRLLETVGNGDDSEEIE